MTSVFCPKTRIFAPECWKMSQRPRFQTFSWGACCQIPLETCEFFSIFAYSKAFNALIYLQLIENTALCYGKESPIKGCYEGVETILHYH